MTTAGPSGFPNPPGVSVNAAGSVSSYGYYADLMLAR